DDFTDGSYDGTAGGAGGDEVEKRVERRGRDRVVVAVRARAADVVKHELHPATAVLLGLGHEPLQLREWRVLVGVLGSARVERVGGRDALRVRAGAAATLGRDDA